MTIIFPALVGIFIGYALAQAIGIQIKCRSCHRTIDRPYCNDTCAINRANWRNLVDNGIPSP